MITGISEICVAKDVAIVANRFEMAHRSAGYPIMNRYRPTGISAIPG
jgi:hypothetical protein